MYGNKPSYKQFCSGSGTKKKPHWWLREYYSNVAKTISVMLS